MLVNGIRRNDTSEKRHIPDRQRERGREGGREGEDLEETLIYRSTSYDRVDLLFRFYFLYFEVFKC